MNYIATKKIWSFFVGEGGYMAENSATTSQNFHLVEPKGYCWKDEVPILDKLERDCLHISTPCIVTFRRPHYLISVETQLATGMNQFASKTQEMRPAQSLLSENNFLNQWYKRYNNRRRPLPASLSKSLLPATKCAMFFAMFSTDYDPFLFRKEEHNPVTGQW